MNNFYNLVRKEMKELINKQTMNMPIVLLVMFPFFVLMIKDIGSLSLALRVILYLIPFSHPTIAAKALIFGNYLPVIGGMASHILLR